MHKHRNIHESMLATATVYSFLHVNSFLDGLFRAYRSSFVCVLLRTFLNQRQFVCPEIGLLLYLVYYILLPAVSLIVTRRGVVYDWIDLR